MNLHCHLVLKKHFWGANATFHSFAGDFDHCICYVHTLIDSSILLFLNSSQEQLSSLREDVSHQSTVNVCDRTVQGVNFNLKNYFTTYFLLLSNFLRPLQTFSLQQSVTCSTCPRARFKFRHPLSSERIELQLQFN